MEHGHVNFHSIPSDPSPEVRAAEFHSSCLEFARRCYNEVVANHPGLVPMGSEEEFIRGMVILFESIYCMGHLDGCRSTTVGLRSYADDLAVQLTQSIDVYAIEEHLTYAVKIPTPGGVNDALSAKEMFKTPIFTFPKH